MREYFPKNAGFVDSHITYPVADLFSEPAYAIGATPNGVTILTFIIRCVAIYYLYRKERPQFVMALLFVSWFTDALDGIMARKYDMKTEIGAHLDCFVDITTCSSVAIVLLLKYYTKEQFAFMMGVVASTYAVQIIKLRSDPKSKASAKPWEKALMNTIPLDIETNCFISNIDPGVSYLIMMAFVYHALFYVDKKNDKKGL